MVLGAAALAAGGTGGWVGCASRPPDGGGGRARGVLVGGEWGEGALAYRRRVGEDALALRRRGAAVERRRAHLRTYFVKWLSWNLYERP